MVVVASFKFQLFPINWSLGTFKVGEIFSLFFSTQNAIDPYFNIISRNIYHAMGPASNHKSCGIKYTPQGWIGRVD